jgi:ADP-heptose:LPS heptosyltransferase
MTRRTKKTRRKPRTAKDGRPSGSITPPECKNFTGYKPCFPDTQCYRECIDFKPIGTRILIVNLDAMGNVLVTTSILPALKRKYPQSHISWITLRSCAPLLQNNPYLDRVYIWEPESWLVLQRMTFDVVLNVDKSQRSGAFTMSLQTKEKLGFGINKNGVIVPLNKEAGENYLLGLDDHLKFRVNQKTVSQLQCEQFKLKYRRDEYVLNLHPEEEAFCEDYRKQTGIGDDDVVVGFNTGCSELYPNKKMTIEQHVELINRLYEVPGIRLVLLGGPEDTYRNAEIVRHVGDRVINTPTTEGLRKGICCENLCDVVITGDSLGMHIAIGLKKYVIVWFGVSCWTEVDLFERGVKLIPYGLYCSPCWKKECPYNLECIQMIDLDAIVGHAMEYRNRMANTRGLPLTSRAGVKERPDRKP